MAWPLLWHFRSGEKHSLFFWEHMDTFGLCQKQLVVLRPGLIASPQCLPNASRVTVQKMSGISSRWWEAQSPFISAHTFCHCSTPSSISLFLLAKSRFPNHNKSKQTFPFLLTFPCNNFRCSILKYSGVLWAKMKALPLRIVIKFATRIQIFL